MNVRTAMLKAADSIERNPLDFDFDSIRLPDGCGTPSCALGWTAFHLGVALPSPCKAAGDAMGIPNSAVFYERMNDLTGGGDYCKRHRWKDDATVCAATLRLYADKYHPAESPKHVGIPDSVRAIFAEKVAA
jgi:hypothetical protein